MKEVLKNVGASLTLEDCERFYSELHIACAWNDGKEVTMEIERPISSPAKMGLQKH